MKSEKPMLTTGTEIALRKSQVGILVSYQANGFTYYLKDDPKKKHLYKGGHPVKYDPSQQQRQTA